MNFGYTQVLFVGSVPRINCLIANVSWVKCTSVLQVHTPIYLWISYVDLILILNIFYRYDKLSKGVSIVSHQLPYTLQLD